MASQSTSTSTTRKVLNSDILSQILSGLSDTRYTQKNTDELMRLAEQYYMPQYNAEVEAARQAQAAKDLAYTQQLENLTSAYGKNVDAQNAAYDKSRAALETGALSRGMGRSSYTMQTLNNNDQARSAALMQLAEGYGKDVRQVSDQRTQSAAQSAETIRRLESDKATNIANRLQELAELEYQKYITGINQQNSNYLSAVQAALGEETISNSNSFSGGGRSSGNNNQDNNNDNNTDDNIDSTFDADVMQNEKPVTRGGSGLLKQREKQKQLMQ